MVPTIPQSTRPVYPESPQGPMALPFVLLRDKNQDLTHEQSLLAAFGHMANLMDQSRSGNWNQNWQNPWDRWKTGKFRKIVKRANPQRFAGLAQDPEAIRTTIQLGDELLEILSLPPYLLQAQDARVKPLQVAGLDYRAEGRFPLTDPAAGLQDNEVQEPGRGIVLAYDGSLGASTGKMMAQAAHGAQLLMLKEPNWRFNSEPIQVLEGFDHPDVEWLVEVVDAGFTEVAPNSNTVRVGRIVNR